MKAVQSIVHKKFEEKFTSSKEHFKTAKIYMPGGNTKSVAHHSPFMVFAASGKGARIMTEDNVELNDFVSAYGAVVLGHCHPDIEAAVIKATKKGTLFGTVATAQTELARKICERIPSIEQVRFTATGTEACTFALKMARAYTKKSKVLMFKGGFHGTTYMALDIPREVGEWSAPEQSVIVCEWNDAENCKKLIRQHASNLACVIMEGFLGANGVIAPTVEFLRTVEYETKANDVLLVYDEITSLRAGYNGYQTVTQDPNAPRYPDITVLGKLIGGGYPLSAIGGSAKVMSVFDNERPGGPLVGHSGTHFGHSLPCAAGVAALNAADKDCMARLASMGADLATKIRKVNAKLGFILQVHQIGPILNIHFSAEPVVNATQSWKYHTPVKELLYLELLNNGIFVLPRLMIFVSAAHTEPDLEMFAAAYEKSLQVVRPAIEELHPSLVRKSKL